LNPLPAPAAGSGYGYTPAQIRQAYDFNQISFRNGTVPGDGRGQTIAIIEPAINPNIVGDANSFSAAYGLWQFNTQGGPILEQIALNIDGHSPSSYPTGLSGLEADMDVEWAHAMAPEANILVVDAPVQFVQIGTEIAWADSTPLYQAAQWVANQSGGSWYDPAPPVTVVSMSFGGNSSQPPESSYDSYFTHAGVTFVASAGDHGEFTYPASSPNVLAVGGTSLQTDISGNYLSESIWNDGSGSSGGGQDPNYPTTKRPDVAYNADPQTGYVVYDTYDPGGSLNPYSVPGHPGWIGGNGGASAAAPQWAALIAIANQGLALDNLGPLTGSTQTLSIIHSLPNSDFHQNIPGWNSSGYSGPDVYGMGTPYADRVVAGIVQASADRFVNALYQDFLGRPADPGGAAYWVSQLPIIGRQGVVNGIARSTEAFDHVGNEMYAAFLGRPADPLGEAHWASLLQQGASEEWVMSQILASPEFLNYAFAHHFTNQYNDWGFVESLYEEVMRRYASPAEIQGWVNALAHGESRAQVAYAFVTAPEFRSDAVLNFYGEPAQGRLPMQPFFTDFLHRPQRSLGVTSPELNSWIFSGLDLLTVEIDFASSLEFFEAN
jgi:hypothetical protein